jgi:hypothetical protein
MICSVSALNQNRLQDVQSLEQSLGVRLLALSCHEAPFAELTSDKAGKVEELEKKLGVTLLAVT